MKRLHLNCIGKSALLLLLLASFLPMTTWAQDNNPTYYGLSVNGTDVTSQNNLNVLGDGKVSYDPDNNVLTLNNANIQQGEGIIVSSNYNSDDLTINLIESTIQPQQGAGISVSRDVNLTINLIGGNSISAYDGCIRTVDGTTTTVNNATLTFTKGTDNGCNLNLNDASNNGIVIGGFKTSTLGTGLRYDGDYTYSLYGNYLGFNILYNSKNNGLLNQAMITSDPPAEPIMWSDEGTTQGVRDLMFDAIDAGELHYSIDYVDDNYNDVTDAVYNFNSTDEIVLSPCTVTAYVIAGGMYSSTVTGKFFGFAQSVVNATPHTSVTPPSVVPALPNGATMSYSVAPANSYVTYNSTNGKFDITGTGNYDVSGTITMPNAPSQTITILNIDDGNGGYIVSPFQFNVGAKPLDLSMVADIPNRTFDGDTITPAVTVMDGNYQLQLSTDYTVMYYDNVNASTNARVEITGKGNYYGTVNKYFTIDPKSISTGYTVNLATEAQSFTYTAGEIKPAVTLSTTGAASIDPSNYPDDFDVDYFNNVEAATPNDANPPTVTVTGKGNYTGSASAKFTINPAAITELILSETELTYTGSEQTVGIASVKAGSLTLGTGDYTVSGNTATAASNYTVTVIGKGNYSGTKTANFTIVAVSLEGVDVDPIPNQTYTGQGIEPPLTVTFKGNAVASDEYTAVYTNNTNFGQATVTLTSTGQNFTASSQKIVHFNIGQATATLSGTDQEVTYNGQEQPYTNGSTTGGTLVVTYYPNADARSKGSNAIGVPVNAGTYYVRLTQGDNNYTSTPVDVTLTINPAAITELTLSETVLTYTGSEQTAGIASVKAGTQTLTTNDYTVSGNKATTVGKYTVTVTAMENGNFSGTKSENFNIVAVSLEGVDVDPIPNQTYTGQGIEPPLTVTFNGNAVASDEYTAVYTNNTNFGQATVTLTSTGQNFTASSQKIVHFNIGQATATLSGTDQEVTYNGQEQPYTNGSTTDGTLVVTYYPNADARSKGSNAIGVPVNAGTYYVRLTQGDNNYTSTPVDVTLTINPAAITELTLSETVLTYTGSEQTVGIASVKAGTLTLSPDDYTVSGNKATAASNYTVTVTGKGNYSGTKTANFTINPAAITELTLSETVLTYTGSEQTVGIASVKAGTLTLSPDDYTVSGNKATAASNYTVTVTGKGNYSGTKTANFTINPAAITELILSETVLTYTGSEQTVGIASVKAGTLTLNPDDYTVSGNTAKDPGPYTVTVTAKANGNFSGFATAGFTIVNRTLTVDDIAFANGQTFASFFTAAEDFDLSAGLVAHVITGVDGNSVTTQALSYVPKNVPVLIEKTTETVQTNNNVGNNLLRGTSAPTAVSSITDGTVYVLYNNEFVRAVTGTIPANRSYLVLNDKNAGARLRIVHDSDATAIDALDANADTDMNVWYDQSGRKLQDKPTRKGLYIQNGKKVVIK